MHLVYEIMQKLCDANLYFSLSTNRNEVITINVVAPGKRLEIDVFSDEKIDIAMFKGDEVISTEKNFIDTFINGYRE